MANLLPLESFREIIQYNPFHFWGLGGARAPVSSACNSIVKKYSWQTTDALGRQNIQESIETAERRMQGYLHFAPAPRFHELTLPFPSYPDTKVERVGYAGGDERWITLQLPDEGYVESIGVEARDLIDTPEVVLSDADGDGLSDTFTVTVTTTITNPASIAVYFQAADRMGHPVGENFRIAPVNVAFAGGTCTITGRIWQIVRPELYERYETAGEFLHADQASNYATHLEVYHYYCNPDGTTVDNAQAMLIWETRPFPAWAAQIAPPYSTDPAAQAYAIARVGIRDAKLGIVNFGHATYDATTGNWYSFDWCCQNWIRPPDRVRIRFRAGYPATASGNMDMRLATAVARFACAEMSRRICACDTANRELYHWQFDLSRSSGAGDESYAYVSREMVNNPYGTRRGHLYAWQETKAMRIGTGFSV